MPSRTPFTSLVRTGLLAAALGTAVHGATDPRVMVCAQPCTLVLKAADGTIDIKDLQATPTLKTLYKAGDEFHLDANRKYALMLNESKAGLYNFELQLIPQDQASIWTFRIQTKATEPFIRVVDEGWSHDPGKVVIQTERAKPLITFE